MGEHKECTVTTKMKCCCCCDKGTVVLRAKFDKGDYKSGDIANLVAEIDNSQSKNDVQAVSASFYNHYSYKTSDWTKSSSWCVKEVSIPGLKAGESCVGHNAKTFQISLGNNMPSCAGSLIVNRYTLSVEGNVGNGQCCAEGRPVASTSINIYNKPLEKQIFTPPENWTPTVMNSYVCSFSTGGYTPTPSMETVISTELDYSMVNPNPMPGTMAKTNF